MSSFAAHVLATFVALSPSGKRALMPRPPRIDFPGAFHHVMNRGADHQCTYRNPLDKGLFLTLWEQATSRFGIEVLCYALMGNHYHVFVYCPDGQLSRTMQFIGRSYTQEFNHHHGRDGALFRGRFHSTLVDSETYFAQVARYIELNPVSAGVCTMEQLAKYEWSSYRYSAGFARSPYWLSTHHLRARFAPAEYRSFVTASHCDDELIEPYKDSPTSRILLGSPRFIERVTADNPQLGRAIHRPKTITVEEIEAAVIAVANVSYRTLAVPSRPRHPARTVAMILSSALTNEPRTSLAERFGYATDTSFITAVTRANASQSPGEVALLKEEVLERLGVQV